MLVHNDLATTDSATRPGKCRSRVIALGLVVGGLLSGLIWTAAARAQAPQGITAAPRPASVALRRAVSRTLERDGIAAAGPLWVEEAKLAASDGAAGDRFGIAVDISSDTALVGAKNAIVEGNEDQGAAYVFVRDGAGWVEQAKLTASDGAEGDLFGGDVVAIDGDTALIGAWNADVDGNEDQGAAYVFVRSDGVWTEQAKLTASDGAADDHFGVAVGLDGDTALIGATDADIGDNADQGAAYVFVRDGEVWSEQDKLFSPHGAEGDRLGLFRSALSGDVAVVGAWQADVDGKPDQGRAHVFTRDGETWLETARLTASDGAAGEGFGISTALDGDTILIGSAGAAVEGNPFQGAAYVFTRNGETWQEEAKLSASDGASGSLFGVAVDLVGDTALVGAAFANVGGNDGQGAAYLFTRSVGTWDEQAKLTASDGAAGESLGFSVALAADTALVGSSGATVDGNALQGAAYLFAPEDSVELSFEPASLDFGEVEIGVTGGPLSATLHNSGTLEATQLVLDAPDGDFAADVSACDTTLPPGGSCTVEVTFTPSATGPAEASVEVASIEGASASLALTGTGIGTPVFTATALAVDPGGPAADGNGVFEPNELIEVLPSWRNDGTAGAPLTGTASAFQGPEGATYTLELDGADYGVVEPDATASCQATGTCYRLGLDDPAVRPATHWTATFDETLSDGTVKTWALHIGDSFDDVPRTSPFYLFVETLLHAGVTGGCDGAAYCPAGPNTRAQMAVFVLKALEGPDYPPTPCVAGDEPFDDVPVDSPFCPWINDLSARGVVAGCGGGDYCPDATVSRAQMAVFLLRAREGTDYTPPECTADFTDVPCSSTFAAWIEELAARGITGGCADGAYCPAEPVTRQQMAVFVTKTFGLALYEP